MILTANSYQKSAPSSGKCRNYADFEFEAHAFWGVGSGKLENVPGTWMGECESAFKTAIGAVDGKVEEDFGQHMLPQSEANEAGKMKRSQRR